MKHLFLLLFLSISITTLNAQCSLKVNAKGKCSGDIIVLEGALNGNIAAGKKPKWTQTAGTKAIIQDDNKLNAYILPPLPTGNLTFKLSVPCEQGSTIESSISLTINQKPYAGKDTFACSFVVLGKAPDNMIWYDLPSNPKIEFSGIVSPKSGLLNFQDSSYGNFFFML